LSTIPGGSDQAAGLRRQSQGASYGYTGLFDAVRINDAELTKLYEYDLALLESVDKLASAVDNVETSLGRTGLPAAIRNLVTLSQGD
jgi:hypothetical protein